jgi:hypothetical protein
LATHADVLPWVDQQYLRNMDAATRGAFLSLTLPAAIALMEKMASNQGRNEERV